MPDMQKMSGMPENGQEQQKQPPIAEFEGYAECPLFSEMCRITIDKEGMAIAGRFHQLPILYGEIQSLEASEFQLRLETAGGQVVFSRMGQELEWLADKLRNAYNDAVVSALLITGKPILTAQGSYHADEGGKSHQGQAEIRLYEDCLCILPPDENARRLPLCFLTGADKEGYSLTLTLSTGERYTLSKMGRELDELDRLLTKQLRALREKTLEWHKKLAPSLGSMQAASAGSLMPLGCAADFGKLKAVAPPLATALEEKLGGSRMAQTWSWLRELCGGAGLMLGALPAPEKEEGAETLVALPQTAPTEDTEASEEVPTEPAPILWLMASDKEGGVAAVELALGEGEAAATYLYRIEGGWDDFSLLIDRALEAAAFQREAILLPEDKLALPEHITDAMLVKRTPAIARLRRCFAGRAIHSSFDRWLRDVEKCRSSLAQASKGTDPEQEQKTKYCTGCGAKLTPGAKFCGQCGTPQS